MAQEIKYREAQKSHVRGSTMSPLGVVSEYDYVVPLWQQRTYTSNHPLFFFVQEEKKRRRMPDYWLDFMSTRDLGGPFRTEKGSIRSNYRSYSVSGFYTPGAWNWSHSGPLLLNGFKTPLSLASASQIQADNATLFALGGTAIARCRPGKPGVDLGVMLGELKKDGIPTLIGSLFTRSRTLRDIFRNSGSEYLNVQFGWAPLIRDLQDLCRVVTSSRELLQAHEKQLNKLLRRTYRFETIRDTVAGRSKTLSNYELPVEVSTSGRVTTGAQLSRQVPEEITSTVTNSHFNGGFRFYYPDISTALDDLMEIEHEANLLLGTRLDPEVLWNLQPWTWLADWFVNFGDVLGNLSALISDDLVMQYGYIMMQRKISKEITLPRGLYFSNYPGASYFSEIPLVITAELETKSRAQASPFGFGLTPGAFTPQQWAILAALGMSQGLPK
jgi:hypothetical protein